MHVTDLIKWYPGCFEFRNVDVFGGRFQPSAEYEDGRSPPAEDSPISTPYVFAGDRVKPQSKLAKYRALRGIQASDYRSWLEYS